MVAEICIRYRAIIYDSVRTPRGKGKKSGSFGHVASQAPVFVQWPNPSSSIWATIFRTRCFCSGLPCGREENCASFADTNRLADEFLHVETQAPQPIQAAALNASIALSFSIGIAFPSGALPVLTET